MRVLAIDQGTSGTKALVVDPEVGVLSVAEHTLTPAYLGDGAVEQEPAALLASVLQAGRRAVVEAGGAIDAVALANQGESVLAWDRVSGEPLSSVIVWQDRRAEVVCRELAHRAADIAHRTGLTLDSYFSAPKMTWLRRSVTGAGVVTTTDTWLVHHLTGAFVTDATTASRSLLMAVDDVAWDPELIEAFALDGEALPDIVDCDHVAGTTSCFGGREVPVTGLVVDQQAALVAQGCLSAGEAKCTFGTGAFLLATTGSHAARSAARLTTSVAWATRESLAYCLDGQVHTAGSAVRWLRDIGLVPHVNALDAVAADDAGGVVCVPAFAGLAAPWWQPDAAASLAGMTLATTAGQLVRGVLEGVAAQVAELARCVESDLGAPLTRLRVDGGLTRSGALMQAAADVLQLPVEVYPSAHATPLGAAALARGALQPSASLRECVVGWEPWRTYRPRWTPDRAADFRHRWRATLQASAPVREEP